MPQDSVLLSGTVAENIAYGVPPEAIDMQKVERAARRAHANEFGEGVKRGLWGGYWREGVDAQWGTEAEVSHLSNA